MSEGMMPQPAPTQGTPPEEPKRIKVFGILHIVFGALGLFSTLFTMVVLLAFPAFINWVKKMVVEEASNSDAKAQAAADGVIQQMDALMALMSELTIPNWVQAITSLIVALLILIAGIALVKRTKSSLAKSNRYAWSSLAAKLLNLVLFFTIGMAATRRYYEKTEEIAESMPGGAGAAPGPGGLSASQFEQLAGVGGGVVGIVLGMVYPILALAMLNTPRVKEYLTRFGK